MKKLKSILTVALLSISNTSLADGKDFLALCSEVTPNNLGKKGQNKAACIAYTKGVVEGSLYGSVTLMASITDSEAAKQQILTTANKNLGKLFSICLDDSFTVEELVIKTKSFIESHPEYAKTYESSAILEVLLRDYSNCE